MRIREFLSKATPASIKETGLYKGAAEGVSLMEANAQKYGTFNKSVLRDIPFQEGLKKQGITAKETPGKFLGAYTARLLGDAVNEESRGIYWQFNHPIAIADKLAKTAIDPEGRIGVYGRAAVVAAALQPAIALTGSYDPTNIAELGRPKGYKQNVPDPEDPTKSLDPATEMFQRFFQGRTGRPLSYEKAQQEIPNLTPQRYANYMNFAYNQPAVLGVAKVTGENLEGVPEARVFGYPVTIPSVTAAAGGILGARLGLMKGKGAAGVVGALAGAGTGAVAGVLANQAIAAQGNQLQLPTTTEYQSATTGRI